MIKTLDLFLVLILISACSFHEGSKFWSKPKVVEKEKIKDYQELFPKEEALKKEFNSGLKFRYKTKISNNSSLSDNFNSNNIFNIDGNLKKSSRYKFSRIKKFNQYQPEISFNNNNIIFFDNKGSILQFNNDSKLIWKKNYYSKLEKKMNPILQFASNKKYLIVADNIAKYYMLDIYTGDIIWTNYNIAPFNSQIKIYGEKFFIIDFSNTLRCFSLKDGKELWNIKTEDTLIRSQKKLSMVIVDEIIYFNNSNGDITAASLNDGELLWQLPTQSSLIYESAFTLQTSDIITDKESLFFSNNRNQFFSIDIKSGSFNWENKINSNLRSAIIDDYIISISLEGYLIILEKRTGNIIRVTDIFQNFKIKKRSKIKPSGFVVGLKNIYVTTSNGRLLIVDILSGKTVSSSKIDNEKISKPFIHNKNLFLIKNDSIIKLN